MTPIAPLITAFLREHMPRQRGYSAHSCEAYAICFRLFLTFAADRLRTRPSRLALEAIDAAMVLAFLAHIEQDRGNSPATRNVRLAAIKAFMRYVELQCPSALAQVAQIDAIPGKRHDHKLIRHLTMAGGARHPQRARRFDAGRASATVRCCTCASPAACASRSSSG